MTLFLNLLRKATSTITEKTPAAEAVFNGTSQPTLEELAKINYCGEEELDQYDEGYILQRLQEWKLEYYRRLLNSGFKVDRLAFMNSVARECKMVDDMIAMLEDSDEVLIPCEAIDKLEGVLATTAIQVLKNVRLVALLAPWFWCDV